MLLFVEGAMHRGTGSAWATIIGLIWSIAFMSSSPLLASTLNGAPQCGVAVANNFSPPPANDLCRYGSASSVSGPIPWVGPASPIGPGRYFWSCSGPQGWMPCLSSAGIIPGLGAVINADGEVGATNYGLLPFATSVFQSCFGCSNGLTPMQLFAAANPYSWYWGTDGTTHMQNTRNIIAWKEANTTVVPSGSEQLWQVDWLASFPTDSFSTSAGGPVTRIPASVAAGVDSARLSENLSTAPEMLAWRDYVAEHPQYWDIAYNGQPMPIQWQSWHGQWGFISPLTPLDPKDCPPDMNSCTWGDSYAFRQGVIDAMTGAYGIGLSDFSDSFPYGGSTQHDFNPRIIAAFASFYNLRVASGGITTEANWIDANAYNQWNDYLSRGYGMFFKALAARTTTATGREALIIDQCQGSPFYERSKGADMRILASEINPAEYICGNDDHSLLANDIEGSIVREYGSTSLAASYEPLMRQGANFEADDSAFWQIVASSYASLNSADQTEVGYKLLKRLWLWGCWAHIADRSGDVHRAIAYVSRNYEDTPTGLTARQLGPLQSLVQNIVPSRPFGPAIYYSAAALRTAEKNFAQTYGVNRNMESYAYETSALQAFVDSGGPVDYYVSDAALNQIEVGSSNAPSAWIILGNMPAYDSLPDIPSGELEKLKAIAPVVDVGPSSSSTIKAGTSGALAVSTFNALANQPLSFTTAGGPVPVSTACQKLGFPVSVLSTMALTGFGFYDTNNALVLVVSNPSQCPDAITLTGTINLKNIKFNGQLANGTYNLVDLFSGIASSINVVGGHAVLPVTVARWDSQAYSIAPAD